MGNPAYAGTSKDKRELLSNPPPLISPSTLPANSSRRKEVTRHTSRASAGKRHHARTAVHGLARAHRDRHFHRLARPALERQMLELEAGQADGATLDGDRRARQ